MSTSEQDNLVDDLYIRSIGPLNVTQVDTTLGDSFREIARRRPLIDPSPAGATGIDTLLKNTVEGPCGMGTIEGTPVIALDSDIAGGISKGADLPGGTDTSDTPMIAVQGSGNTVYAKTASGHVDSVSTSRCSPDCEATGTRFEFGNYAAVVLAKNEEPEAFSDDEVLDAVDPNIVGASIQGLFEDLLCPGSSITRGVQIQHDGAPFRGCGPDFDGEIEVINGITGDRNTRSISSDELQSPAIEIPDDVQVPIDGDITIRVRGSGAVIDERTFSLEVPNPRIVVSEAIQRVDSVCPGSDTDISLVGRNDGDCTIQSRVQFVDNTTGEITEVGPKELSPGDELEFDLRKAVPDDVFSDSLQIDAELQIMSEGFWKDVGSRTFNFDVTEPDVRVDSFSVPDSVCADTEYIVNALVENVGDCITDVRAVFRNSSTGEEITVGPEEISPDQRKQFNIETAMPNDVRGASNLSLEIEFMNRGNWVSVSRQDFEVEALTPSGSIVG